MSWFDSQGLVRARPFPVPPAILGTGSASHYGSDGRGRDSGRDGRRDRDGNLIRPLEKPDATDDSDSRQCNDDDFCYKRWKRENSACWQWKGLGMRVVKACQARASTRRDLCIRNGGKPDPSEQPEYNPFVDYPR